MTPWDSDKSTAVDPDSPDADEQLTADEWDNHVSEGHFPADQLNFGTDNDGNPIATDPQTGDTVLTWDRSAGAWVLPAIATDNLSINGEWQSPISDRSKNTIYTADTLTWVSVPFEFDTTNRTQATLVDVTSDQNIDQWVIDSPDPQDQLSLQGVIPAGHDYQVTDAGGTISLISWKELN